MLVVLLQYFFLNCNFPFEFSYFFEFKFPTNYPFSPPNVIYNTNDGRTRFNPNLFYNLIKFSNKSMLTFYVEASTLENELKKI